MFDLPKPLSGEPEEQVAQIRKYLFQLIEKLNELELKVSTIEDILNQL